MSRSASEAEWSRLVAEWKRSGLSAGEFAAQRGFERSTLYWWSSYLKRRRDGARRKAGKLRLIPVQVAPETTAMAGSCVWELSTPSGHVLRAFATIERTALHEILAVLIRAEGKG